MLPAIRAYLRKQGGDLVDLSEYEKRVVAWEQVMTVASRFFYADQLREDGSIARYICAAKNGITDLPGDRDLVLEAFAYAAIFRHLGSESPGVLAREKAALSSIAQQSDLPADSAARILAIRKLYYAHMAEDSVVRDVLRDYHAQKADYLPFVIED
jgi:hypothetical protein